MPIDLSKIPSALGAAAAARTLIPFVGAGISRSGTTEDPGAYPTWSMLLKELCKVAWDMSRITSDERAQIDELVDERKYLMAAQALKSTLPLDVIDEILERRFMPPDARPGPTHRSIVRLQPPLIITTNYDVLLEDACAAEYGKVPRDLTYKEASKIQALLKGNRLWPDRPIILKIHGSASAPSDTILSEMDYRNLLYREPGYRLVLSAVFVTKVVLMLGFSFDDPELRLLLESLRDSLNYRSRPDYILLPRRKNRMIELKQWREDYGLEAIEYDASPDHREVLELIDYLATFVPSPGTAARTPRVKGAPAKGTPSR
jgi:hypothetical protein